MDFKKIQDQVRVYLDRMVNCKLDLQMYTRSKSYRKSEEDYKTKQVGG